MRARLSEDIYWSVAELSVNLETECISELARLSK
jgi:hypothetical protein